MSVPNISWDETSPAGSDNINAGDNRIRELKAQIREIVDVDHKFDSSGQDADMGKHNKCTFIEAADIGTGATGLPILGAQTVSGKAELLFTDEDDNDIQLTSAGSIGGSSMDFTGNDFTIAGTATVTGDVDVDGTVKGDDVTIDTNDTFITSKDNAGTGTVDLIKADTNDVAVVPDGTQNATNAAPSNDKDLANKKYVDDSIVDIGTIEDYGTGTSSGTSKTLGALKIYYGTVNVSGASSQAITNLNFTSASTYTLQCTFSETFGGNGEPIRTVKDSGSQCTIHNDNGADLDISWVAIGT